MASTRAGALAGMPNRYGPGGHCCHAAVSADKVRLLMVQTFIMPADHVARKCRGRQMSAVVKSSPQLPSLASPDCSLQFLCRDTEPSTGAGDAIGMVKAQSQRKHRLARYLGGCDSLIRGSRGVSRPKVAWMDWCGNVKSITSSQHTLNIIR
jgi:hypothetical protein